MSALARGPDVRPVHPGQPAHTTVNVTEGPLGSAFEERDIEATEGGAAVNVRRVMVEVNANAKDLAAGHVHNIQHASSVFGVSGSDGGSLSNVIITGIESRMSYSDCPEGVSMSMRMFESELSEEGHIGVTNDSGWLYQGSSSEWGPGSTSTQNGYTNLHAIMPYERSRDVIALYDPQNVQNNRFIQTYGGYHGKNLWNNIIPFPKENYYYVDKDHVVMQVVAQNWDTLGINPGEEMLHENRYVKMAGPVVDSVVKQLETTILTQMPFTNLSAPSFKFTSKPLREWAVAPSDDKLYKIMCELKLSYMFPSLNGESDP